ncbi:hypothetical protein CABS01_02475 [Colletotrichum abscissum]|uniref:uncharacterized protein n=1 Tax=Colletotrichum abscissum TaxID=1671311 RepID=UPI0027D63F4C|nr:uncharacterized protein CABS01_02475 [Colletotrichum abscissum]KAK1488845.1 hypothetical protein CABS01_02475 [Colletotrichum abscissum]
MQRTFSTVPERAGDGAQASRRLVWEKLNVRNATSLLLGEASPYPRLLERKLVAVGVSSPSNTTETESYLMREELEEARCRDGYYRNGFANLGADRDGDAAHLPWPTGADWPAWTVLTQSLTRSFTPIMNSTSQQEDDALRGPGITITTTTLFIFLQQQFQQIITASQPPHRRLVLPDEIRQKHRSPPPWPSPGPPIARRYYRARTFPSLRALPPTNLARRQASFYGTARLHINIDAAYAPRATPAQPDIQR